MVTITVSSHDESTRLSSEFIGNCGNVIETFLGTLSEKGDSAKAPPPRHNHITKLKGPLLVVPGAYNIAFELFCGPPVVYQRPSNMAAP